jgi:hypothetical protein
MQKERKAQQQQQQRLLSSLFIVLTLSIADEKLSLLF